MMRAIISPNIGMKQLNVIMVKATDCLIGKIDFGNPLPASTSLSVLTASPISVL